MPIHEVTRSAALPPAHRTNHGKGISTPINLFRNFQHFHLRYLNCYQNLTNRTLEPRKSGTMSEVTLIPNAFRIANRYRFATEPSRSAQHGSRHVGFRRPHHRDHDNRSTSGHTIRHQRPCRCSRATPLPRGSPNERFRRRCPASHHHKVCQVRALTLQGPPRCATSRCAATSRAIVTSVTERR